MNELAIFISPNKEIYKKVLFWKSKFKSQFGNQLFIDHPPHITLANFYSENDFLIIEKLYNLNRNFKQTLSIEVVGTDEFINDPVTKQNTPYISVENSKNLNMYQKNILNSINLLIKSKFIANFENNNYNLNIKKYNYPYVGDDWKPHITIGSFKNEYLDSEIRKEFLNEKINFRFNVNMISVFKIVNNQHIKLEDIKINNE